MNAIPIKPASLFQSLSDQVAEATGIDPDWVFLTPAPELLGRLPPASTRFAAVIPTGIAFPESPQHQQVCPADVRFDVAIFSRVAIDRAFDGRRLLVDSQRGLFPAGDSLIKKLAGSPLETPAGQLTREPIECLGIDSVRWAEGSNIVLAYLVIRFVAPIIYDLS